MAFAIKKTLAFIDSMQFMDSSLGALVKTLSDNDFKYLSQEFTGEQLKLVKQKGVYLYEYVKSLKTFSNDKLANRCEFYISLKDECISEKYYLRTINVWNILKEKAVGDYHGLYLKTDVLSLAVFERFIIISTCLKYYGLDPCHYFSSPGLSWDALLKMIKIELKVISDIGIYRLHKKISAI